MKFERLEFDDVAALYIGLHSRSSLDRYMTAREQPIVHKVTEANVIRIVKILERNSSVVS